MKRILSVLALSAVFFSAPVFCQTDADTAGPELRKPRKWALSAEVGMNSLASLVGPVVTFYVKPQFAMDLGAGLSSNGLRPGLRARYLFSREKQAYFGGLGLKYALGSSGKDVKVEDPDTKEKIKLQVDPSGFLDLMAGTEYLANNGFLFIATAGYSMLLGGRPYAVSEGYVASEKAKKLYDTVLGSGITLSLSAGKAF